MPQPVFYQATVREKFTHLGQCYRRTAHCNGKSHRLWPNGDVAFVVQKYKAPMRAVIQRVRRASVAIQDSVKGRIEKGLLVLLAVEETDAAEDIEWLSGKIVRLRVFPDAAGAMNRSVLETGGDLLVISQFTLYASTRKGNRPSFTRSASPVVAIPRYEAFVKRLEADLGKTVATGEFGADMQVELVNDGPVTIIIDSKLRE